MEILEGASAIVYPLLIIAVIAAVYFGMRLLFLKSAVKKANAELGEILSNIEENRIVKLSTPNRDIEKLLVTINALLEQIRQKAIEYRLGEKRLKKEVESISHDLRTPLTSILGYLKLIDSGKLDDDDKASLETVKQKAYVLQRLITQFYDLSRISSGSLNLDVEDIDIAKLLREYITGSHATLVDRGLIVSIDIPDRPVIVSADTGAAERIIHNLLHNAEKYAKSTLNINLTDDGKNAYITFENDTDNSGNANNNGIESTGLGLMISRHLAEEMGGNIRIGDKTEDKPDWFSVTIQLIKST